MAQLTMDENMSEEEKYIFILKKGKSIQKLAV